MRVGGVDGGDELVGAFGQLEGSAVALFAFVCAYVDDREVAARGCCCGCADGRGERVGGCLPLQQQRSRLQARERVVGPVGDPDRVGLAGGQRGGQVGVGQYVVR